MDMNFAVSRPLVRRWRLISGFVHRLAHLIHASFRPRLAAVALASSLALTSIRVGGRTFTSKLLSMPSTQRGLSFGADRSGKEPSLAPLHRTRENAAVRIAERSGIRAHQTSRRGR